MQTWTSVRKQRRGISFFGQVRVPKLFFHSKVRSNILNQSQEQAKLIANNKGGLY